LSNSCPNEDQEMASFRQRNNKWQARISRDGHPDQVKTFESKADAERWARSVESEMDKGHFVRELAYLSSIIMLWGTCMRGGCRLESLFF
jgi:hypothetical protein